jgi:hypothetical protein
VGSFFPRLAAGAESEFGGGCSCHAGFKPGHYTVHRRLGRVLLRSGCSGGLRDHLGVLYAWGGSIEGLWPWCSGCGSCPASWWPLARSGVTTRTITGALDDPRLHRRSRRRGRSASGSGSSQLAPLSTSDAADRVMPDPFTSGVVFRDARRHQRVVAPAYTGAGRLRTSRAQAPRRRESGRPGCRPTGDSPPPARRSRRRVSLHSAPPRPPPRPAQRKDGAPLPGHATPAKVITDHLPVELGRQRVDRITRGRHERAAQPKPSRASSASVTGRVGTPSLTVPSGHPTVLPNTTSRWRRKPRTGESGSNTQRPARGIEEPGALLAMATTPPRSEPGPSEGSKSVATPDL